MGLLLKVRDRMSRFYGEHDTVIRILAKFCMALCAFAMINASLGQISFLCNPVVVGALALVCAFLPSNSTVMIGAGMILVHFYGISLEAAIAGGGMLIVGMLLYFSIAPHSAVPLILTAITMRMGIPSAAAVLFGLVGGPLSAVGVIFGVFTWYLVETTNRMGGTLESQAVDAAEAMVQKMTELMNSVISSREMAVMAAALAILLWIVWLIRRMAVKYAWMVAAGTGLLIYVGIRCISGVVLQIPVPALTVILDVALAAVTAMAAQAFLFSLDYRRTENVRFEDDEYFYYVKAVPKRKVYRRKRSRRSERR